MTRRLSLLEMLDLGGFCRTLLIVALIIAIMVVILRLLRPLVL